MPWKETDKMEQKELFIKAMLANEKPFKHLCADFGISEKTGHKWKNRFYEQGKAGLYEQSRARLTQDMIDGDTAAECAFGVGTEKDSGDLRKSVSAKGCSFVIQR